MRKILGLALMGVALINAPCAIGQLSVSYAHVFKVQTLTGSVKDELGAPIKGVKVEECSEDWKVVLYSTITDEKGYFSFVEEPKRGLHYLRLRSPGFDQTRVKVRISHRAHDKELSLRMYVAA